MISREYPDFVELGTLGHQINATGLEIGVFFHSPQSEVGIDKIKSTCGREGKKLFFQLLELGYEKFPHNTTAYFHGC